jgi:hypothetical protein
MPVLQQPAVGPSPLPGGVAAVVRFLFDLPPWIQIAGATAGLAVAIAVVAALWRRRRAARQWVAARRRGIRIALAAAAAAAVAAVAGAGVAGWNYMQHDNGFCTGCHVMGPAYERFTRSEHDSLSCHDCHQQSLFASMRQLYLWVAERPQRIGPHAKVPSEVCARCHVTGSGRALWQRIASTAGHRTHLESDSAALKGIQCVTCHGLEVHRFAPVDSTCAQAGCHVNIGITMGRMRGQTSLHCVTCHRFTREVPALFPRDSARGRLVPGVGECFSCHQMRVLLAEFDPARDPHAGTCGACHNPHTQAQPQDAAATCASAGCHAGWRAEPFHVGARHRRVATQCTLCHQPHAAKVDPSDCAGCHQAVRARRAQVGGRRLAPPLPFDTAKALRRVSQRPGAAPALPAAGTGAGVPHGPNPGLEIAPSRAPATGAVPGAALPTGPPAAPPDTFPHDRHKSLACLTCHVSAREHGRLTFQPPRGCQICHHEAPARLDCARCHGAAELAAPAAVTVKVAAAGAPARAHPARFEHAAHRGRRCVECHTTPVTLAAAEAVASCKACHEDHHAAGRPCDACHALDAEEARDAHAPPERAHLACDACHAPDVVARLAPDRPFCLMCHPAQRDHYAARECTVCHLQGAPDAVRPLLVEQGAGADST